MTTASRFRLTSLSAPRFRLALWAVFGGALVLAMLVLQRIAHAAADPLGVAQASVDGGMSLLVTAGPIVGGMYLTYSIGNALLARYHASSWLAQGKRLAIATSALGIAGAALQAQVTGGSWAVIAMAAIAAAFKLLTPTVTPPSPPSPSPIPVAKVGSAVVIALLVIGIAGAVVPAAGCGGSQGSRATTIGSLDSGIQTATAALRAYEHEHAESIIAQATLPPAGQTVPTAQQLAAGKAALAAFRLKVDKVWLAVDVARAAVDAANTLNDDSTLTGAKTALDNAFAAITALTGGTTP